MPSYLYIGPGERAYTGGRDASGRNIGLVQPGDIRIFDEPPADGFWVPEIPPRDGESGEGEGETPDPGAEGDAGEPGDGTPPGPQPAPPAVIPGT